MTHKYDLLTVKTDSDGPQRHHPWFKERLQLKFLKTSKHSAALDGARWRFVARGTDDFRTGLPRQRTKLVRKKEPCIVPIVKQRSSEVEPESRVSSTQGMLKLERNPGLRTLYGRVGPRLQMQMEYINAVETSLLHHPLALYPHLEDSIPLDVVDDVVELLDPGLDEVLSNSETTIESDADQSPPKESIPLSKPSQSILIHAPTEEEDGTPPLKKDPVSIYKFPLIKTEAEKEHEMNVLASKQVISAKQQSRVKQVTHDLVQWAEKLGGSEDSAYIDEQTIKSLFGSNYETKPILMAPIQVVELTNIPPELRPDSHARSVQTLSSQSRSRSQGRRRGKSQINYYGYQRVGTGGTENWPWLGITIPQVVKSKYGAWYLPVSLWKYRPSDEPLLDPKLAESEVECEQAIRKKEMDEKISTLHGAKVFKEFVSTSKRGIMPAFLEPVKL